MKEDSYTMGEFWKDVKPELRLQSQERRQNNLDYAIEYLRREGIKFAKHSEYHFLVGDFDYWPTTGLFINRTTKKTGRGIRNLIVQVRGTK